MSKKIGTDGLYTYYAHWWLLFVMLVKIRVPLQAEKINWICSMIHFTATVVFKLHGELL